MESKLVISLFLFCLLGSLDCTDQKELTVIQGADATLECSGPRGATKIVLRWDKPDLQSEDLVIFFKGGQFQEETQHELFKDRVKMKDEKWNETGDFSVILKNVTTNDAGTYDCEAAYNGDVFKLLSKVNLTVDPPGQRQEHTNDKENKENETDTGNNKGEDVGLIVGVIVGVLVAAVLVAGFVRIYKKRCGNTNAQQNSYQPTPTRDEPVGPLRGEELKGIQNRSE